MPYQNRIKKKIFLVFQPKNQSIKECCFLFIPLSKLTVPTEFPSLSPFSQIEMDPLWEMMYPPASATAIAASDADGWMIGTGGSVYYYDDSTTSWTSVLFCVILCF
jgi:hypothetical protein